jgi:hypothetical protein
LRACAALRFGALRASSATLLLLPLLFRRRLRSA